MKLKCSYANKYKAIFQPKCGCDYCENKWKELEPSGSRHSDSPAKV